MQTRKRLFGIAFGGALILLVFVTIFCLPGPDMTVPPPGRVGLRPVAGQAQGTPGAAPPPSAGGAGPIVLTADRVGLSRPLRDIPPLPPVSEVQAPENAELPLRVGGGGDPAEMKSILQDWHGQINMPTPLQNWEGIHDLSTVFPPDTQGDVGPNHYIQWVNLWFQIWDKSGGSLYGPAAGNTLWSGFGGPCETTNDGDPITLYDQLADRWVMSQFALPNYPNGPFYQCFAVSQTPNPLGAWHLYQFTWPNNKMNDYPKIGVWPDGYYMTVNQFTSGTGNWAGAGVAAFERSQMLQGLPAQMVAFDLYSANPNYGGMLPADWDGSAQPPAGAPCYFAEWDDSTWIGPNDAIRLWEFHVDWATPANSTFGDGSHNPNQVINTSNVDPDLCGYNRNCIPQPGKPTRYLDAISDRLMYQLQYRNFGTYQAMVTNHTVDANGSDRAGIHWFELRKTTGTWSLNQEGVYSPDTVHRWMGSIAMDGQGNMALGYSVSSTSVYPGIRYAGRLVTDPLNSLPQAEAVLQNGTGIQDEGTYYRWGDYSMMSVDPADDCTFWYTQEYYQTTSERGWQTRVGSFKFPGCTPGPTPTPTRTPTPTNTPTPTLTPTNTPTRTPTNTPSPGPSPTPTPTSPLPPPEGGGEQAPECLDDAAGTLSLPGQPLVGANASLAKLSGQSGILPQGAVTADQDMPAQPSVSVSITGEPWPLDEAFPAKSGQDGAVVVPQEGIQVYDAIANVKLDATNVLPNNEQYVSLDADSAGNLYVAYEMLNTNNDLVIGKSTDNGLSWELRLLAGTGNPDERYPALTVDDGGYLWIAYKRDTGTGFHPAYWKSTSPGDITNWTGSYWSTTNAGADHVAIDVLGSGSTALIYLAFEYPTGTPSYREVNFGYSADGGTTWNGWYYFDRNVNSYYPSVALAGGNYVSLVWQEGAYGGTSQLSLLNSLHGGGWAAWSITGGSGYPDMVASGSNVYLTWQDYYSTSDDDVLFIYSTTGGQGWGTIYAVAATTGVRERYPAVSAVGSWPRVAYFYGTDAVYLELAQTAYGASWGGAAYQVDDATNTPNPQPRYLDVSYRVEKHPAVVWSADPSPSASDNVYYSTLNDPPTAPALAWPSNGPAITAFAPSLRWNASTDSDGDTVRYWYFVDTVNPPVTRVGGPMAITTALPYYTDLSATYYWKVYAVDGYESSPDSATWSFGASAENFSGSPGQYSENFDSGDPPSWTKKSFACLDCFEYDPIRWTVSPAGKWVRSSTYAWSGSYSARALYDANNADYQMTSPASGLDLRGTTWAYFNTHFRGSSEAGYDLLYLDSRPDGTSSWTSRDIRSGDYSAGWWAYYEGNIDLSPFAGSTTGQMRLRFATNGSGISGIGWYEDEIEVARQTEWARRNISPFYYSLQAQGSFIGYTNNLVDQFYSPYIQVPNNVGRSILLTISERYAVSSGDTANVWIRDVAADTWQKLASYNGLQDSWTGRTLMIPDSYKGRVVVIAFVLHSDSSGALGGPEETGGYWDVDDFILQEYFPTGVRLTSFTARPVSGNVLVTWETATERDNVGFNLYRSTSIDGMGEQLNAGLIPSRAPGGDQGASYEFVDETALPGVVYYYTLEDVDINGTRTRHGPVVLALWRVYLPLVTRQ